MVPVEFQIFFEDDENHPGGNAISKACEDLDEFPVADGRILVYLVIFGYHRSQGGHDDDDDDDDNDDDDDDDDDD